MFVSSSLNVPNMIWYLSVSQHYQIRRTTSPAYKTSNPFFPLIDIATGRDVFPQQIHSFAELTSQPDEMHSLSILQILEIYSCLHLLEDAKRKKGERTSLPDKMHSLSILQKLEIYNCLHLWKISKGNRWRSTQDCSCPRNSYSAKIQII